MENPIKITRGSGWWLDIPIEKIAKTESGLVVEEIDLSSWKACTVNIIRKKVQYPVDFSFENNNTTLRIKVNPNGFNKGLHGVEILSIDENDINLRFYDDEVIEFVETTAEADIPTNVEFNLSKFDLAPMAIYIPQKGDTPKLTSVKVGNITTIYSDGVAIATIDSTLVTPGSVTEQLLATDSVTTSKIANESVTGVKIHNSTIGTIKIIDGAITTPKIHDEAVTKAKLAEEVQNEISSKQDKLTAGNNITITNNVISAKGGSEKPEGGWQKDDLAIGVRTTLSKADDTIEVDANTYNVKVGNTGRPGKVKINNGESGSGTLETNNNNDLVWNEQNITSQIDNKVDKVSGKGLSTNDYTDADKAKVASALQSHQDISGKQDVISDLATIRSGAAKGATAVQPADIQSDDIVINGYKAVDLGIVLDNGNHLLWAACNVGAETETDYGKYFQWGDTVGYTDTSHSTWSTCPFNNGSSGYDSTYFASVKGTVCPNGILAAEYDAATVNMGGNWIMPTKSQMQKLLNNTNNVWATINGVKGRKFTSKTDSSKYIFLPASGEPLSQGNEYGYMWCSSLVTSDPISAWGFNFNQTSCNLFDYGGRASNFNIRGVIELTDDELKSVKSRYYTKSEVDTIASGKVDKVSGKGLSTNDYTNTDKAKVAAALTEHQSLAAYAKKTEIPTSLAALDSTAASQLTQVGSDIGTMSELDTDATTLVGAINEVNEGLVDAYTKTESDALYPKKEDVATINQIKAEMENLPDGQAVSAQVATNTTDIADLAQEIHNEVDIDIIKNRKSGYIDENGQFFVYDGHCVSYPQEVNEGDVVNFTAKNYGCAVIVMTNDISSFPNCEWDILVYADGGKTYTDESLTIPYNGFISLGYRPIIDSYLKIVSGIAFDVQKNTGDIQALNDFDNEKFGREVEVSTANPANGYIDNSGYHNIGGYFISQPFEVKSGEVLSVKVGNWGCALVAHTSSIDNFPNCNYTIDEYAEGEVASLEKDIQVTNDSYYVICWKYGSPHSGKIIGGEVNLRFTKIESDVSQIPIVPKPSFAGKNVVALGDSHSMNRSQWMPKLCELTGMKWLKELNSQIGVGNDVSSQYEMWFHPLRAQLQGLIDNKGDNNIDVILVENVHYRVSGDKSVYAFHPSQLLPIGTFNLNFVEEETYWQANYATLLGNISEGSRKANTLIKSVINAKDRVVTFSASSVAQGVVTLVIDGHSFASDITNGMSLADAVQTIASWNFGEYCDWQNVSYNGNSITLRYKGSGDASISFSCDGGTTRITASVGNIIDSSRNIYRYLESNNDADFMTIDKWHKMDPYFYNGWRTLKGFYEDIQKNFPKAKVITFAVPNYSFDQNTLNNFNYAQFLNSDSYNENKAINAQLMGVAQMYHEITIDVENLCNISPFNWLTFYTENNVHPNADGYNRWAETIAENIQ